MRPSLFGFGDLQLSLLGLSDSPVTRKGFPATFLASAGAVGRLVILLRHNLKPFLQDLHTTGSPSSTVLKLWRALHLLSLCAALDFAT